jgi:hypothetical protein
VEAEITRRLGALVQAEQLTQAEADRISQLLSSAALLIEAEDSPSAEALREALAARGLPTKGDLADLARQIEALSAEIDSLNSERGRRSR